MVKTAPPLNDVARRSTADTPLFSPWPWAIGSLAVALLLAMGEVARLVAMVPDREGSTLALTGPLTGPSTLTTWTLDPWHLLDRVTADPSAAAFVRIHVALDLIFIALYAVVLPRLPRSPLWQSILGAPSPAWARRLTMPGLLYAAAVADVVEDLGLLCVTGGDSIGLAPLVGIMGASKVKWLAVFAFIAWAVVTVRRSPVARAALRAWWSGLYRQRFSVMAIAPLALLSLVPAGDVLDQLPDVQRRWFTAPAGQTVPASDIKDMVVAVALVLVEAVALFWLGRMVSEDTARATGTPALRTERWWPWLFGPLIAAGGLCAYGGQVRLAALAVFAGVPLAVIAVSWWATRRRLPLSPNRPDAVTDEAYAATIVAGDVIAVGVLAVGCLALVRSTAVVALVSVTSEVSFVAIGAGIALAVGVAGSAGMWFLARWLLDRLKRSARSSLPAAAGPGLPERVRSTVGRATTVVARQLTPGLQASDSEMPESSTSLPPGPIGLTAKIALWVVVITGTGSLLFLAFNPAVAGWLGVVGTALTCLLSLSAIVGATVTLHHEWGAPAAFRIGPLHAREAPIATLLILALAFAGTLGGADIHLARGVTPGGVTPGGVTPSAPEEPPERPDMASAFTTWLDDTQACTVTVTLSDASSSTSRLQSIRPLLLMAAEGGGARAAYWTASVIDRLEKAPTSGSAERNQCGARQVFLATGVSGGSVGLTVARFRTTPQTAAEHIKTLGSPEALSVASAGLFARDPLTTLTGIPWGPRGGVWHDRAGLIETSWEKGDPDLAASFLKPPDPSDTRRFAAELVLASATAATGCRVLVSHIDIRPGPDPATPSGCSDSRSPAPMTLDLIDAYGPRPPVITSAPTTSDPVATATHPAPTDQTPARVTTAIGEQRCLTSLTASTAAMFSARFPYVTPSGVVGPCLAEPVPRSDGTMEPPVARAAEQLVDGGYVDSTGLGVLIDLAPELMSLIRAHNATAAIPIVPYVIYADNGTGSDLGAAAPSSIPEVAVPPVGLLAGRGSQNSTHALLQRLDAAIDPTQTGLTVKAPAATWRAAAPPISVVYQPTRPTIAAPLGWVLSPASTATMDQALATSAACPTRSDTQTMAALRLRGYGSLHTALKLLGEDTCASSS